MWGYFWSLSLITADWVGLCACHAVLRLWHSFSSFLALGSVSCARVSISLSAAIILCPLFQL